jgi:hypothetical protein
MDLGELVVAVGDDIQAAIFKAMNLLGSSEIDGNWTTTTGSDTYSVPRANTLPTLTHFANRRRHLFRLFRIPSRSFSILAGLKLRGVAIRLSALAFTLRTLVHAVRSLDLRFRSPEYFFVSPRRLSR